MKNNILRKLMTIACLLFCLQSFAATHYDFKVDGICYKIISSDNQTVAVTFNDYANFDYNINTKYKGSIVIPEGVTYNNSSYSVTNIGEGAFYDCNGLTSVTIPESVTSIGDYAFKGCSGLTSITIGNSVTSIGAGAFGGCTSLASITIPSSVTSIGSNAFGDTAWYSNLNDGVIYINNVLYKYKGTMPDNTSISIKEGTIAISGNAFFSCSGLISINIPNSVMSIGYQAFQHCDGLTSLIIPNSVITIGERAFNNCRGLNLIIVESGNTVYDSRDNCNAIIETKTNTLVQGCNNTIISNSVNCIGARAFEQCDSLTSVIIPNSVTSIGNFAFNNCDGLTSVTIGNSVTSIGSAAFQSCGRLISVTIPNSVTNIGNYTFNNCNSLDSIGIPNSIKSIGEAVFMNCKKLKSITIPNSVTSISDNAFYGCNRLKSIECNAIIPPALGESAFTSFSAILKVPFESVFAYKSADGWKNFINYIGADINGIYYVPIAENEVAITYKDTNYNSYSGEFVIPSEIIVNEKIYKITSIGNETFKACYGLTSITIPKSITSIGSYAFYYCKGIKSITIPQSVTCIGDSILFDCTNLTEVICENKIPPTATILSFDNIQTTATLYVPVGSKDAYASATGWSTFTNIVEDDEKTGVESTLADNNVNVSVENGNIIITGTDNAKVEVYSINGQLIYGGNATTIPVTAKGMYIVKVGNTTHKVIL